MHDLLDTLAADRAAAGAETPACAVTWPFLAVPASALRPVDRAAMIAHLDACARCRAVGFDLWAVGDADPPPARRRPRRGPIAAGLGAVALAAAAFIGVAVAGGGEVAGVASPPVAAPPREPLALVVLVDGSFTYMGTSMLQRHDLLDDGDYMRGHIIELAGAVDLIGARLPADADAALVTTAETVRVRQPLGPARDLDRDDLGTQDDYYREIGWADLDAGLDRAVALLEASGAPRKAILLIGPGCGRLDRYDADGLRRRGIAIRAIAYQVVAHTLEALCEMPFGYERLARPRRPADPEALGHAVTAIVDELSR